MMKSLLSPGALERALDLRDLTDPAQGAHCIQTIVEDVRKALCERWDVKCIVYRANPIVTVDDNYNLLGYPPDGAARDARYTRYVTERMMLRSHTSAMIPGLLRALAVHPPEDLLLVCPGVVYRRDTIDRLHTGEPHQLDLWRITSKHMKIEDLNIMIETVVAAALPGYRYRTVSSPHPYTTQGVQIDVERDSEWIEIGECGLASQKVLSGAGLQLEGLAMGVGLDRLLMIRKSIDDIRLIKSTDPRVANQMLDLEPYMPVSNQPMIRRDLSLAVSKDMTPEELGDKLRQSIPEHACRLESVEILSETLYEDLPPEALNRMGMTETQKNVLLRLIIRDPVLTLTSSEANEIRNSVYRTLHEGNKLEIAL